MKLIALQYQRNGVGGESFFHAIVKNIQDCRGLFVITFQTELDKDEMINSSCRVVQIKGEHNPYFQCWRGDRIGSELEKLLNEIKAEHNLESWYDVHTLYENTETGSHYDVRYKKEPQ